MANDEFLVHDIRTAEVPQFSATGAFSMVREVTFFIGAHGPFSKRYSVEEYSAQKVQSDIDAEVQGLRILMSKFQT